MIDDFRWHAAALAGTRGPIYDGEPQSGFYRQKNQRGEYEPVAYWKDSATGEQRCHINGRAPDPQRALEVWPFASRYPISSAAYWHRIDTGAWQDNDTGAAAVAKGPEIDPEKDPAGSLKAEIDAARAGLDNYKLIESDEQASRGQTLRAALTTLSGKADKTRVAEKEPHLQAGRDVDAKWQPLVKLAKEGAEDIRTALGRWEDQKREAARKAQAETDRIAREHAEAVRKAEEDNKPPPAAPPKPVAANVPAPAAQIKGASGRTASVTTKTIVTEIDFDKAVAHFRNSSELKEFLTDLCQTALAAGIRVDGILTEERSVIR